MRLLVAVLLVSTLAGCGGTSPTLTVGAAEVERVRPGMSLESVQAKWKQVGLFFPNDQASGADMTVSSFCLRGSPTVTGFWAFPPSSTPDWKKDAELFFVWFLDRARTQSGIQIGSTIRALRAQYAGRLSPVAPSQTVGPGEFSWC